ncbi:proton-coupled amino acid transporter-like protein pathetic [Anopheles albimanus]|uniref:proton-coupled amino acid transporter-like protein pathetic n=1 Tax=Anopheles albimanus TaxID=7167 RepID=UPI0016404EE6|nr:proton-coupled amino acid transporter-like protein pathetic [Anopheles albimanus]
MRHPTDFSRSCGVMNVGTAFIIVLYAVFGSLGYLRWGDDVQGSVTLNLPDDEPLAEAVKLCVAASVLFGFALQLFIAVDILWPMVQDYVPVANEQPVLSETIFRMFLVLMIFVIGLLIPNLGPFISLMGSVCSTSLALLFPAIIRLIVAYSTPNERPSAWLLAGTISILLLGVVGMISGTYTSIKDIMN